MEEVHIGYFSLLEGAKNQSIVARYLTTFYGNC